MKTSQLLQEAVTLKMKTAPYSRLSFSDLQKAFYKRFGVDVGDYSYGDEHHIFEKVKAATEGQNKFSVKQIIADKEVAQEALYKFEESRIDSGDVEYMLELLIAGGVISPGNFIVDIDSRDH